MKRLHSAAMLVSLWLSLAYCAAQNQGNWQLLSYADGTAVGFGNGQFVVGSGGGGALGFDGISTDGTNWMGIDTVSQPYAITYGNGLFVAVGGAGGLYPGGNCCSSANIATSVDGTNWILRVSIAPSGSPSFYGVTYANGLFVAVGGDPSTPNAGIIMTSSNGTNWTQRSSGTVSGLRGVAYGNGTFVAVGDKTSDGVNLVSVVLTSATGTIWTQQTTPAASDGVAFGNGVFIALTFHYIIRSTDGINWTLASSTDSHLSLHDVIYANNQFVAVGETPQGGEVFVSTDGTNWVNSYVGNEGSGYYSVSYGNGHFIAVGGHELFSRFANVIPDTTAPTVSITAPTANQRLAIPSISLTGTASDNAGVQAVFYQLNSNIWLSAITTNAFTNWNSTIALTAGTNTVKAYAADLSGNLSATSSVSFYSTNNFVLRFSNNPTMFTNGLALSLNASTGMVCRIDVSTNLISWVTLTNFTSTNLLMNFRDPIATNVSKRFYRALVP